MWHKSNKFQDDLVPQHRRLCVKYMQRIAALPQMSPYRDSTMLQDYVPECTRCAPHRLTSVDWSPSIYLCLRTSIFFDLSNSFTWKDTAAWLFCFHVAPTWLAQLTIHFRVFVATDSIRCIWTKWHVMRLYNSLDSIDSKVHQAAWWSVRIPCSLSYTRLFAWGELILNLILTGFCSVVVIEWNERLKCVWEETCSEKKTFS